MRGSPAATPVLARPALRQVGLRSAGVALLAVLLCASCEDSQAGPGSTSARVHGTVRDAGSGRPLKGVRVSYTADTLERFQDKSNEDGDYSLLVDSRALHGRIAAEKDGYAARVLSVYLDDQEVRIDVDLTRD